jgi:hypothetical protein
VQVVHDRRNDACDDKKTHNIKLIGQLPPDFKTDRGRTARTEIFDRSEHPCFSLVDFGLLAKFARRTAGRAFQHDPQPPPRPKKSTATTAITANGIQSYHIDRNLPHPHKPLPDPGDRRDLDYVQLNGKRREPLPHEEVPDEEVVPLPAELTCEISTLAALPPQAGHFSTDASSNGRLYDSNVCRHWLHSYSNNGMNPPFTPGLH